LLRCRRIFVHALSSVLCLFFNPPPPPSIYTLSLHDALPISFFLPAWPAAHEPSAVTRLSCGHPRHGSGPMKDSLRILHGAGTVSDRKSTRLNSSHVKISYAVFCLKKKKKIGN